MNHQNRRRQNQTGFSLIEMLLVVLIIGVVAGGILSQMDQAVQRAGAEQMKLDDLQQARDFVDQFFRDINQIGYPNIRMVDTNPLDVPHFTLSTGASYSWTNPYVNDNHVAMGLMKIADDQIWFEADADGDGVVQDVIYKLNGSGTCTRCLQRSQTDKALAATDPLTGAAASASWGTQINDVQNSPVFTFYKADGTKITGLPIDYSQNATAAQTLASVKTIQIVLQVRNPNVKDLKTGLPLESNFEGAVSLNNCSMAAAYDATNAPMGCQ